MILSYPRVFLLCILVLLSACYGLKKPNILLIVTDDQDSVLDGMTPMQKTEKLLGVKGTTFANSFTSAPVCCPSRSSLLTGMYPHNHEVFNNTVSGGCSSANWQKKFEPKSFAAILQKEANYRTFYAGKYLNEYGKKHSGGPEHVPEGWNEWRGLVGNSKYFNFTLSNNGVPVSYEKGEYLTDIITNEALNFVNNEFKQGFVDPVLVVLAPPAPHAPFLPASRYKDTFPDVKSKLTPNFNVLPKNKHWLLRMPPTQLSNSTIDKIDQAYRARWQTLLSVDDMVEIIVKRLEAFQELRNTYVIYTSDNGYHLGQFAQPLDKRQPYETDIRVPLIVRGPGVDAQVIKSVPTVNVDIAPTILKIAGLNLPEDMDGFPLPIFNDSKYENTGPSIETNEVQTPEKYDRQILIEYHGEGSYDSLSKCPWSNDTNLFGCSEEYDCKCQDSKNNTYGCVRHLHPIIDFVYCAFNDTESFEEAYDLKSDPFQMKNIVSEMMPSIKYKYQNILGHLQHCKGANCNMFNDFF